MALLYKARENEGFDVLQEGIEKNAIYERDMERVKIMATRNNAKPQIDDYIDTPTAREKAMEKRNDDIDVIPDELDDEGSKPSSTSAQVNGQSSSTSSGMTIDQLNATGFDNKRDDHTYRTLNNPTGDWLKTERWKFSKVVYEGDCMPGDIDPTGRTMLIVSGKPNPRQVGDIEYAPDLFLRISPDIRYKKDKPGEIDNSHKLYIKAKEDVYLSIHSERATSFGQLIAMLEEDSYKVRTMNGDNGPIILDIKDKNSGERRS